jgi:exodeoxyribonuclease V alpha subunit
MVFLHSNGVGTSRAVRIFKTYGHDAIQVMTEDPYRLARDIKGVGFRTADAIAMKMGMTLEAPQRVRAGISFALQEATDEGHCGLPVEPLVELATKLLEVDKTIVRAALDHELVHEEIIADAIGGERCIFLRGLYFAERGVAERLLSLGVGSHRHGRRSTLTRPSRGLRRRQARRSPPRSAPRSRWRSAQRPP